MEVAGQERDVEVLSVVIGVREAVLCLGLRSALATETTRGFRVLTTSTEPETLLDECRRLRPSLALVDLALFERAHELSRLSGGVVLFGTVTPQRMVTLLRRGVRGLVAPESPVETIATSLRRVASGRLALPEGAADNVVEHLLATTPASELPAQLSPREQQVLRLVARGLTSKGVAAELHVGERTVKTHLSRVAAKLETRGRAATVAVATQRGLI